MALEPFTTVDGNEDLIPETAAARCEGLLFEYNEIQALRAWLPPEEEITNPLEIAGYNRNLMRHAQHHGLRMLTMLAVQGFLEPDQDPVEVLMNLIEHMRVCEENIDLEPGS